MIKNYERCGKIGASDAPVIMGVSPWKTPYQLWEEQIYGAPVTDNAAMARGRKLEPLALFDFERQMGVKLISQEKRAHPEFHWMTATLDGLNEEKKVLVEVKCPGKEDHLTALDNKVPEKYIPQLQHQLEVLGYDHMYYFSYNGNHGKIVEVQRDDKYIENLVNEEKKFYKCIIDLTPPSLTEKDYIEQGKEWIKIAQKRIGLANQIKALEKEDEELYELLVQLSQEKSSKGGQFKFTKSHCLGAIDYKAAISDYMLQLRSIFPDIQIPEIALDKYRKKSFDKWRLSMS